MSYFLSLLSSGSFCCLWASPQTDWADIVPYSPPLLLFPVFHGQFHGKKGNQKNLFLIFLAISFSVSPFPSVSIRLRSSQWKSWNLWGSVRSSGELGSRCQHKQVVLQEEKHLAKSKLTVCTWLVSVPGGVSSALLRYRIPKPRFPKSAQVVTWALLQRTNLSVLLQVSSAIRGLLLTADTQHWCLTIKLCFSHPLLFHSAFTSVVLSGPTHLHHAVIKG